MFGVRGVQPQGERSMIQYGSWIANLNIEMLNFKFLELVNVLHTRKVHVDCIYIRN